MSYLKSWAADFGKDKPTQNKGGSIKLSARNLLKGKVSKITMGAVNAEVEIEPCKGAHSPLLAAGLASVYKISRVPCGEDSPWLAAGSLQLAGGQTTVSIITINSVKRLGLAVGKEAYAMVKASSVMFAVE